MKATYQVEPNKSTGHKNHTLVVGVILLIGLILRTVDLEIKPPHFDEGINGHFVAKMWKEGFYRYDPTNFHGPLYFYFLQFAELLFGRGIFGFRLITGIISIGCVGLVALHRRFFGTAAIWAAAAMAISPAFVFYSRYAIHESLFIFLQILFSYGYFSWRQERSRRSIALMVASFFGAFSVKETFFVFFGTWWIAIGCVILAEKMLPKWRPQDEVQPIPNLNQDVKEWKIWGSYGLMGALLTLILFSGFLLNPSGIADMFSALAIWTKTGVGSTGHEKPFLYWIDLFRRYEWPYFVALLGSSIAFFVVGRSARILILVGFGTWLAYSLIPYKTPWLNLNFLWPLGFAFGFLLQAVSQRKWVFWFRPLVLAGASAALLVSAGTMLRLNFQDFTKTGEPYVYVQSTMEFKNVVDIVENQVKRRPEDLNMRILVLNRDPWPMPWVFSLYPGLAYGKAADSELHSADVVLVDATDQKVLEERLTGKFWLLPFHIRDSYEKGHAYLRFEKFNGLVPSTTPLFEKPENEERSP